MGRGNSQRRRGAAPRHYKLPPPGPGLPIRQPSMAYGDGSSPYPDAGQDTIPTRFANAPPRAYQRRRPPHPRRQEAAQNPHLQPDHQPAPPDVTGEGAVVEAHHVIAWRQPQEVDLSPQLFHPAQIGQRHWLQRNFDIQPFFSVDQTARFPKQITPPTSRVGCIGGLP